MMVRQRPTHISLFLFCVLTGAYLLGYTSTPQSADGEALLIAAVTTVQHGSPDIMLQGAAEALLPEQARMGNLGTGGLLHAKKGPAPSLLLIPLVVLADLLPWLSMRATAMLFNPLVTALAALGLYWLARGLGYRQRTAAITALLFGLATFALPYVKTLFGEPLVGLLLVIALGGAYLYRERLAPRYLWLVGLALGLAVGVNLSYAVMAGILGLYLFGWNPRRWPPRDAIRFAAPVLLAVLLLGAYNWARFGDPLQSGYHFAEGEGFNRPFLYGVYGMLLSPYKGVFWYNPVLLAAIPGWFMLRRRSPRLAWTVLGLIAAQIATYASWWSWHGGIAWGPRFLLPVTPLAALCLAPVVSAALNWRRPWLHVTLTALVALSVAIQLLGTLYSYFPYYGYLVTQYGTGTLDGIVAALDDTVMYDPATSPVIGQAALVVAGWEFEPAWLAASLDPVHLLAALAIALAGLAALSARLDRRATAVLAALALVIGLNVVAARQQRGAAHDAVRAFEAAIQPPDTTLVASTLFDNALIDVENGARVLTVNAPTSPQDPLAAAIWRYALAQGKRLWFVSWFPPGHPDNWQERELWARYPFITGREFAGHRAVYFDLRPAPDPDQPGGWGFGPLRLAAYGVDVGGGCVRFTAAWEATEPPERDYTWFVHLIDAGGAIVAQQDRAPQGSYRPTSTWQPGDRVRDMLCLPLPDGADVGGWHLRIGFVDPATGERLPPRLPDGMPAQDGFILLPVGE